MAFQRVIKSNHFSYQSIFQTNLKKQFLFETEKFKSDLQMLENTLVKGKIKSAVQINISDNFCFIISRDFFKNVQIRCTDSFVSYVCPDQAFNGKYRVFWTWSVQGATVKKTGFPNSFQKSSHIWGCILASHLIYKILFFSSSISCFIVCFDIYYIWSSIYHSIIALCSSLTLHLLLFFLFFPDCFNGQ